MCRFDHSPTLSLSFVVSSNSQFNQLIIHFTPMSTQLCFCLHCGSLLTEPPEREHGEWLLPCFDCGARNIIAVSVSETQESPRIEIVGLSCTDNATCF
jgi:hypothetical protein